MEKSGNVPELKKVSENIFQFMNPGVMVNPIYQPTCCMNADYFYQSPNRGRQVNQEFWGQRVHVAQCVELTQPREPEGRGETSARMHLHHQPPDGCFPQEIVPSGTKGECCCWDCGATEPPNGDMARGEHECNAQPEGDLEEELEPPLPLKADNEWQHYSPLLLPRHYMHSYGEWPYSLNPVNRYHPQSCHLSTPCQHQTLWNEPQNGLQLHDNFMNNIVAQGSVSVNVPQFSVPPEEGVSQVSVLNLRSGGAEESASHQHEKRRTARLPEECRNVFITYSSDVSSEMVPFVDFLIKQGFQAAIDLFDSPIRCLDINKWIDSYLKDPLTLIVIAISPKYKEDIEGPVVDNHGLQTKYIYSRMQSEFIQSGSLNFRFVPVLFLCTSQKHVPSWLQNTRAYRWPQDTEDLLLRLLREERYMPPPVPVELSLIIKPVARSDAATL